MAVPDNLAANTLYRNVPQLCECTRSTSAWRKSLANRGTSIQSTPSGRRGGRVKNWVPGRFRKSENVCSGARAQRDTRKPSGSRLLTSTIPASIPAPKVPDRTMCMRSIGRGIVVEERERGEVRDISPSRTAGGRVMRAGGAAIVRLAIMPFRAGRVDLEQEYLEHRRTRSVQGSGSWKWWARGVSARRIIIADVGTVF